MLSRGARGTAYAVDGDPSRGMLVVPTRDEVIGIALGAADEDWCRPVIDRKGHPGLDRIDEMIRSEQRGLGWTWERPYTPQRYQWCGAAVGAWYAEAGLHLLWRYRCCSSVERLEAWARYRSYMDGWSHPTRCKLPGGTELGLRDLHRATGGERMLQHVRAGKPLEWTPQPGDIALVGPEGPGHPHGKHVTLVVDWAGDYARTIEGNAGGTLPDGSRCPDGVVRAARELPGAGREKSYTIRTIIRPALADFLPGLELL